MLVLFVLLVSGKHPKALLPSPCRKRNGVRQNRSGGIIQRKSVMMAGRQHDVLTAPVFFRMCQLLRPIFCCLKLIFQAVISPLFHFWGGSILCSLSPNAVETKVDKHAKSQFAKIQNVLIHSHLFRFLLCSGNVIRLSALFARKAANLAILHYMYAPRHCGLRRPGGYTAHLPRVF